MARTGVYVKRPGGRTIFKPRSFSCKHAVVLRTWCLDMAHLDQDLSVEVLSEKLCLCRSGSREDSKRRFHAKSPAAFVRRLRLDEARNRFIARRITVDGVLLLRGFCR